MEEGGGGLEYITCDIKYMIYYETLLLVHAYDIIVFAYDIAHMIYYMIYQCTHVTMILLLNIYDIILDTYDIRYVI